MLGPTIIYKTAGPVITACLPLLLCLGAEKREVTDGAHLLPCRAEVQQSIQNDHLRKCSLPGKGARGPHKPSPPSWDHPRSGSLLFGQLLNGRASSLCPLEMHIYDLRQKRRHGAQVRDRLRTKVSGNGSGEQPQRKGLVCGRKVQQNRNLPAVSPPLTAS